MRKKDISYALEIPLLPMQCYLHNKQVRFMAPVKIDPLTFKPVRLGNRYLYALPGGGSVAGDPIEDKT